MDDHCRANFATLGRFTLVVVFGGICAFVSGLENIFLFYTLVSNPKYRHSHFLYFIFLAVCDTIVSLSYIFLIAVDNIKDYANSIVLARIWWSYFKYVFALCHVAMSTSIFLLVAATFERFLVQLKSSLMEWVEKYRVLLAINAVIIGCLMKGPIVFEIELIPNGNCTGLQSYVPDLTDLCKSFLYGTVYKFYIRNIVTVFVPFLLLASFNTQIVFKIRKRGHRATLWRFSHQRQVQTQVRMATRMLVVFVSTYLVTNLLNVLLTAWEHIDMVSLLYDYQEFYMYMADVVSVLAVLGCLSRLPVFVAFDHDIREVVLSVLLACCPFLKRCCARLASKNALRRSGSDKDKINRRCSQFDKLALSIALSVRHDISDNVRLNGETIKEESCLISENDSITETNGVGVSMIDDEGLLETHF